MESSLTSSSSSSLLLLLLFNWNLFEVGLTNFLIFSIGTVENLGWLLPDEYQ